MLPMICAPAALAQEVSDDSSPQAVPAPLASEDSTIVVTGSRIQRRDYESDSPISTLSIETLQNSSEVSIDQTLNRMPQFSGGQNQITSATDVQASPTSTPGIATVNLRGLGQNRTLVLLDGRRTQPANASLVIDVNTIPTAALDGVEVITGGAGSTYGADAVAGVVNFKLKRNFTGLTLDAQAGIAEEGDNETIAISGLLGSNFADGRGNAMLALGYTTRKGVYAIDRPFYAAAYSDPDSSSGGSPLLPGYQVTSQNNQVVTFNPLINRPTQAGIDAAFLLNNPGYVPGDAGIVGSTFPTTTFYFNQASSVQGATVFTNQPGNVSRAFAPGYRGEVNYPDYRPRNIRDASGNVIAQELVANSDEGLVSQPLDRFSLFGHSYYDITDDVTAYFQGNFNQNQTRTASPTYAGASLFWGVAVPFDAATCGGATGHVVPDDLCTMLRSRATPNAPWQLAHFLTYLGPLRLNNTNYTYELLAGLRGNLGLGDWTFDVFGSHGKTTNIARISGIADSDRLQTVMSRPNWGAGSIFQNVQAGVDASCTSGINPFLTFDRVSADCGNLVGITLKTITDLEQDQVEANVQGSVLELPAGPLQVALGANYRRNSFAFEPDNAQSANNLTSHAVGLFNVQAANGSTSVKEVYGEALIPVTGDLPFVQDFTINAGYRLSDYNTAGTVHTWKVTGNLEVNDFLTLRGGYQVANRAPNVAELFQPGSFSTVAWTEYDPCSINTGASYGNRADNPNRAQVIALCNQLPGIVGTPISETFNGQFNFNFGFGRDQTIGNADLKTEEAKTWTAGFVLQPDSTPVGRFTLAVDWYNIAVDGAIAPATTQYVYQQCFNANGSNPNYDPANPFCQLITRQSNGNWASTRAEFTNLGRVATAGLDAQLDWSMDAPGLTGDDGSVFASVNFNYLDKYEVQITPADPAYNFAGTVGSPINTAPYGSQFRWKLYATLGYDFGPGSLSLSWRHLPSADHYATVTNTAATHLDVDSYDVFNLAGRYRVHELVQVRFGVDNLFDRDPLRVGVNPGSPNTATNRLVGFNSAAGVTDATAYDVLGRRYYIGLTAEF
jgi:outer membrane receptor protein involved in Fe transport